MGRKKIGMAVPVALDDELRTEVKRVAELRKEADSTVMRAAIRAGLPVVAAGGLAEMIQLDGELSRDLEKASREVGISRTKLILESIRLGFVAVYSRFMRQKWRDEHAAAASMTPFNESLYQSGALHDRDAHPILTEHARALSEIRGLREVLGDLQFQVPEAKHRLERAMHLSALRASHGSGGGYPTGLQIEEIEKQIHGFETNRDGPYSASGKTRNAGTKQD
jgi:hypothetical protein